MEIKFKKECFPPGTVLRNLIGMKLLTFIVLVSTETSIASTFSRQTKLANKLSDPVEVTNAAEQQKKELTGSVKVGMLKSWSNKFLLFPIPSIEGAIMGAEWQDPGW